MSLGKIFSPQEGQEKHKYLLHSDSDSGSDQNSVKIKVPERETRASEIIHFWQRSTKTSKTFSFSDLITVNALMDIPARIAATGHCVAKSIARMEACASNSWASFFSLILDPSFDMFDSFSPHQARWRFKRSMFVSFRFPWQ